MCNHKWWKWPKNKNSNYNPWYTIAWKDIFLIPAYLLLWVVCFLMRTLDPYPHYYRYDVQCETIYHRADGPQCVVNVLEYGEGGRSVRSEQWHITNDNYTRITEQEAHELRQEALYPRVFVSRESGFPSKDHICLWFDMTGQGYHVFADSWGAGPSSARSSKLSPDRLTNSWVEITGHYTAEELIQGAGRERCSLCKGKGERGGPDNTWRACYYCNGTGVEPEDTETYTTPDSEKQSRDQADAPELTDVMRDTIQNYMETMCMFDIRWSWMNKTTLLGCGIYGFRLELGVGAEVFSEPVAELNALCDEVETEYKRHLADQVQDAVEGGE